jgi:hypothetical protein
MLYKLLKFQSFFNYQSSFQHYASCKAILAFSYSISLLFNYLFMIDIHDDSSLFFHYPAEYASYSFINARFVDLKIILINNFSNFTNLPCSLQMQADVYFYWYKLLLLYHLSIVIGMIYTWHRTVSILFWSDSFCNLSIMSCIFCSILIVGNFYAALRPWSITYTLRANNITK